MKLRTFAVAAVTTGIFTGLMGSGRADLPKQATPSAAQQATPSGAPRRAAPLPFDSAKRVVKLGEALKLANLGVTSTVPQTLEMRLTPIAPRLPNGAEINRAGPMHFNGAASGEPDGSYTLVAGSILQSVNLRVPTEPSKLYFIDCRLQSVGSAPLKVLIKGATMQVQDGHAMHAFQASAAWTEILVAIVPPPNTKPMDPVGHFYGCDIGKGN